MSGRADHSRMLVSIGAAVVGCAAVMKLLLPSLDTLSGMHLFADQGVLAGFAFLLGGLLLSREGLRLPLPFAFLACFVLFLFVRGLFVLPGPALRQAVEWSAGAAVLFVTARSFRTGGGPVVLGVFAGALSAVAVIAAGQEFLALPELRARAAELASTLPPSAREQFVERLQAREVFGPFTISNALAAFCLLALGVFAGAAWGARAARGRWTFLALALLSAFVLFLTRSKGGFLAAGAGLAAAAGVAARARGASLRRAALLSAGLLAAGAGLLAALLAFGPPGAGAASAEVRLGYWRGALRAAALHPVLGGGAGTFADRYVALKDPQAGETKHAHCDYLEILVEEGAVGLLLFLAAILSLFLPAPASDSPPPRAPPSRRDAFKAAGLVWAGTVAAVALFGAGDFNDVLAHVRAGNAAWTALALAMLLLPPAAAALAAGAAGGGALRGVSVAVVAALAAFLAHAAIDFDFFNEGAALAFFAAAGAAAASSRRFAVPKAAGVALLAVALLLSFAASWQSRARDSVGAVAAWTEELTSRKAKLTERQTAALAALLAPERPSPFAPYELSEAKGELCEALASRYRRFLELAAEHYRNAVMLNPLRFSCREALGRVLLELSGGEGPALEEALRCYEAAVSRYPTNAGLLHRAAAAFRKAGRTEKADEFERRARDLMRFDLPPGARVGLPGETSHPPRRQQTGGTLGPSKKP